jgi:hypothetical protein
LRPHLNKKNHEQSVRNLHAEKLRRRRRCALIVPGKKEAILGITALSMLDLAVDPINGKIFGAHGEKMMFSVK